MKFELINDSCTYFGLGVVTMACGFMRLAFLLFGLGNKFLVFIFVPEARFFSGGR